MEMDSLCTRTLSIYLENLTESTILLHLVSGGASVSQPSSLLLFETISGKKLTASSLQNTALSFKHIMLKSEFLLYLLINFSSCFSFK